MVAAFLFVSLAAAQAPGAPVRLGSREVLRIHAAAGGESAEERARRASVAFDLALADEGCENPAVESREAQGSVEIRVCDATVLRIFPEDAAWEGRALDATARRWAEQVEDSLRREKAAVASRTLLRRALTGLAYPVVLLVLLWLARRIFGHWRERLRRPPEGKAGVRIGPLQLFATSSERRFAGILVSVVAWAVYLLLVYGFLAVLFRQLPRTQEWAAAMIQPVGGLLTGLGQGFLGLVPRLVVLLALVVGLLAVLRALGRLFDQVRRGQVRAEPFLTRETAGPAELGARLVAIGVAVFLASLLVPGTGGHDLRYVFLVLGLAVALGSTTFVANLVAGVVTIYGRPFHRGDRVRAAGRTGTVASKGILHVRLESDEGGSVLVPNRLLLSDGVAVLGPERRLSGEVVLDSKRGVETAVGLLRHAVVEAGLKRDGGSLDLVGVRDGGLVFRVDWPLPKAEMCDEVRGKFVRALLEHGPGLEVAIRSALARERFDG